MSVLKLYLYDLRRYLLDVIHFFVFRKILINVLLNEIVSNLCLYMILNFEFWICVIPNLFKFYKRGLNVFSTDGDDVIWYLHNKYMRLHFKCLLICIHLPAATEHDMVLLSVRTGGVRGAYCLGTTKFKLSTFNLEESKNYQIILMCFCFFEKIL